MKTISVLREELAAAQAAYLAADIEHPTQSTLAKDDLANARHEYQHACVEAVEKLISFKTMKPGRGLTEVLGLVTEELWK